MKPGDSWTVVKERLMLPQNKPLDESENKPLDESKKKPLDESEKKPWIESFLCGLCFLGGVLCVMIVNSLKRTICKYK